MRVFVLSTGRCGSMTFVRACEHMTNFTAAHESRAAMVGPSRFDYPDQHIEVDNRLSWFLGGLSQSSREDDLFVWLRRDPVAVTDSFLRRWDSPYRAGMIRAFAHGIVMRSQDWLDVDRRDVCRFYVDTVEANINAFIERRDHLVVRLESAQEDFRRLWERVDAEGSLDVALSEWSIRHNASDAVLPGPE